MWNTSQLIWESHYHVKTLGQNVRKAECFFSECLQCYNFVYVHPEMTCTFQINTNLLGLISFFLLWVFWYTSSGTESCWRARAHFFLHQNERKHEISQLQLTACQHERAQPPLPPPPLPSSPDRCELSPLQEYDLFPLYYARLVSALRKCPTNASGAGVSPCAHRVGGFESLLKQTWNSKDWCNVLSRVFVDLSCALQLWFQWRVRLNSSCLLPFK